MKGTKIHASCKKSYLDKLARKFSNVFSLGMWRNIENFSISNPTVSYRPTNHPYKINFIYGTDITPSKIQNDSMFLSLVDFQTIQNGVEDANILIGMYIKLVFKLHFQIKRPLYSLIFIFFNLQMLLEKCLIWELYRQFSAQENQKRKLSSV